MRIKSSLRFLGLLAALLFGAYPVKAQLPAAYQRNPITTNLAPEMTNIVRAIAGTNGAVINNLFSTTIVDSNLFVTNIFATNIYTTNLYSTNILGPFITNFFLYSSNIFTTNIYTTNLFATFITNLDTFVTSNTFTTNIFTTNITAQTINNVTNITEQFFTTNEVVNQSIITNLTVNYITINSNGVGPWIYSQDGFGTNTTIYALTVVDDFIFSTTDLPPVFNIVSNDVVLAGFDGTNFFGDGGGLTNLQVSTLSSPWTNNTASGEIDALDPSLTGGDISFAYFNFARSLNLSRPNAGFVSFGLFTTNQPVLEFSAFGYGDLTLLDPSQNFGGAPYLFDTGTNTIANGSVFQTWNNAGTPILSLNGAGILTANGFIDNSGTPGSLVAYQGANQLGPTNIEFVLNNSFITNLYISNLFATNIFATNAFITNLYSTNAYITNITANKLTVNVINSLTNFFDNLTVTNGLTNLSLSASQFVATDANKKEISTLDGSTLTNLTYKYTTNSINTGVLVFGKSWTTNISGNIVLGSFTLGDTAAYESMVLWVTNTGASVFTVTLPSGVNGAGDGRPPVYYSTNGANQRLKILVEHTGVDGTNSSAQHYW